MGENVVFNCSGGVGEMFDWNVGGVEFILTINSIPFAGVFANDITVYIIRVEQLGLNSTYQFESNALLKVSPGTNGAVVTTCNVQPSTDSDSKTKGVSGELNNKIKNKYIYLWHIPNCACAHICWSCSKNQFTSLRELS